MNSKLVLTLCASLLLVLAMVNLCGTWGFYWAMPEYDYGGSDAAATREFYAIVAQIALNGYVAMLVSSATLFSAAGVVHAIEKSPIVRLRNNTKVAR